MKGKFKIPTCGNYRNGNCKDWKELCVNKVKKCCLKCTYPCKGDVCGYHEDDIS